MKRNYISRTPMLDKLKEEYGSMTIPYRDARDSINDIEKSMEEFDIESRKRNSQARRDAENFHCIF